MKIRTSFISNSSSSSFVIVAKSEDIQKAKSKLTDFGKKVIDEITDFEEIQLYNQKMCVSFGENNSEDFAACAISDECDDRKSRKQEKDNSLQKTVLEFISDSSDKTYIIEIVKSERSRDKFDVKFSYGRTGSSLVSGVKNDLPLTYDEALKLYNSLISQKINKGYEEKEEDPDYESDDSYDLYEEAQEQWNLFKDEIDKLGGYTNES